MTLQLVFMIIPAIYAPLASASQAPGTSPNKGFDHVLHDIGSGQEALEQLIALGPKPNPYRLVLGIAPDHPDPEAYGRRPAQEAFSNADWDLTELFWKRPLLDSRLTFEAGFVNITDSTIPTIPMPDLGLGVVVHLLASDQFHVSGGLTDANSDTAEAKDCFNSFLQQSEYFKHIEIGWSSSQTNRFDHNIHLTAWHADERKQAFVEGGYGLAFSANRLINDTWLPFVQAGYSNGGGALLETSMGAGIEFYFNEGDGVLGFSLNWGRPPDSELDDQYVAELFNRLWLGRNLELTTDLQWTRNPAWNPDKRQVWILSVQVSMAF